MLVFLTVPCFPLSVNLKKLLRSGCCWFFGGRAVLDSCLSIYKSRGSCLLYYIYIFFCRLLKSSEVKITWVLVHLLDLESPGGKKYCEKTMFCCFYKCFPEERNQKQTHKRDGRDGGILGKNPTRWHSPRAVAAATERLGFRENRAAKCHATAEPPWLVMGRTIGLSLVRLTDAAFNISSIPQSGLLPIVVTVAICRRPGQRRRSRGCKIPRGLQRQIHHLNVSPIFMAVPAGRGLDAAGLYISISPLCLL